MAQRLKFTDKRPLPGAATAEIVAGTDRAADEVLAVARALAIELHPHLGRTLSITRKSDLDRDLGLDSLGRAELIMRLNQAFGIRLPEGLIADARTPGDLIAAVGVAALRFGAIPTEWMPTGAVTLPPAPEPIEAETLLDVLEARATDQGDRPHLRLWRGDGPEELITYAALDARSRAVAGGLIERGIRPGERVAIMLPTEPGFFAAFFGVLQAGAIPVPIYPPFRRTQVEEHLRRQSGILRNADASLLITGDKVRGVGTLLQGLVASLRSHATVAELAAAPPLVRPIPVAPDATALIQYTSGSTGDPKGVVISHTNLLANIRAMGQALDASSADVVASWLPLYHDMGLIGCWLGSLYFGAQAVIMPPLAFMADPARWLRAIHHHRATISAAPNFAYELCLKAVHDADVEGLDLRSLRRLMNGAEPVSPGTIARFVQRFARYGLRPDAMAPVYGLAESTVALAFPPLRRAFLVDRIDRDTLATRGIASPARPDAPDVLELVACGQPIHGHEIRIVDDAGRELPDRHEGRLQFRGPSATAGYFRSPEKTRALFDRGWLESGDRAYVAAGDVYITGRIKDIIIRAGRHIYPHELEELVSGVEGVRRGCVVAMASQDRLTGTERLVVVAETRLPGPEIQERLRATITEASRTILDQPPDEVVLVPPHAIPKTSSGKIRRVETRALYERGALGREQPMVWWQIARLALTSAGPRLQRIAGRISDLAYAAGWWASLVVTATLLWPLVVAMPRRQWRHAAVRLAARAFLRLTRTHLAMTAEAPLPNDHAIFVANHSSYLDGAVLCALCPGELSFVAKEELAGQIVAGPFLRRLGTVFVRRTDTVGGLADMEAALPVARSGQRLVWFPEGTFTRMPGLLGFHLGAFHVAAEVGVAVVPVSIRGTRSVLRGGQWFPRRGDIAVHFGRPLIAGGKDFAAALRLRDDTRAAILGWCGEPDLAYERMMPARKATVPA